MKKQTYYTLLLSLLTACLWAQPNADFTMSQNQGCDTLTVQFTNLSTGNGLNYFWDFDDGGTSVQADPIHVFATFGGYWENFNVCLYITDDQGLMDTICQVVLLGTTQVNDIETSICQGDTMIVNGTIFDINNPSGQFTFPGGAFNGCDSIINVNLTFLPIPTTTIQAELCESECYNANGTLYCQDNPVGEETIVGGSFLGCDSIIIIDLTFLNNDTTTVTYNGCDGDGYEIVVAGTAYNESNPDGVEFFINQFGCDSTVIVDLVFNPATESQIIYTGCSGDGYSVTVNGSVYNESNPTGTETMADINGCDSTVTVSLTYAPTGELAIVGQATPVPCGSTSGGSICVDQVLCGTPPYTYDWGPPGETNACINDLAAGTYNVTVSDAMGNTGIQNFLVELSGSLVVESATTDASCFGGSDGSATITVMGGTPPYSYNPPDLTDLAAGIYSVTVTDDGNCSAIEEFVIGEPAPIMATINSINANCTSGTGCLVIGMVSGGCAPYTYLWSNGNTQPDNCDLPPGMFTLTITDCNGCMLTSSTEIQDTIFMALQFSTTCATPGQDDGNIGLTVLGGVAPYMYDWSNGFTTQNLDGIAAGEYSVTVTDAAGCTASGSVETNDFVFSMSSDSLACTGQSVQIMLNAFFGTTYSWEPAALLDDPTASSPTTVPLTDTTTFSVTITQTSSGCEDIETVTYFVPEGPAPSFSILAEPTCGNADGSLFVDLLCGMAAPPYTYEWEPAVSTTNQADNLLPGIYMVTVTDGNGLSSATSIELVETDSPPIAITGPTGGICSGASVSLCAPVGFSLYQWNDPSGNVTTSDCIDIIDASDDDEGCYFVTVTDFSGCTSTANICIEVFDTDSIITSITADAEICAGEDIMLEVIPEGGLSQFTFSWTPAATLDNPIANNPIAAPLVTTVYEVVVVDNATGCQTQDTVVITVLQDCVWPGDTDTNKVVNNFDLLNIGLAYDSIGPLRPNANLLWDGQPGPDWTQDAPNGSNYKHIDTDGNGIINSDDTLAITANLGEMHNILGENPQQFIPGYPVAADGTVITVPFYVQPDTLIEGANASLPIILGEENNLAENVYGIAFTLEYDTAVVVPGSAEIGFGDSWLGVKNDDMLTLQFDFFDEGEINVAMTRIDGQDRSDYGQLGQLFITVEDDILLWPGDDDDLETVVVDEAIFNITNVLVINHLGEMLPVVPTETISQIDTTTDTDEIALEEAIRLFPNPAEDRIWVTTKNIELQQVALFSLSGKLMLLSEKPSLDVGGLADGLYLVKVYTDQGVYVEKVMVKNRE